ncbi:tyrosine-type recombinase/integrase [Salmonella enterica subsp. enterica serovar Hvittingfoss]|nr:integrase [Salmonella enterica subsp. enterica serovar Newport]EGG7629985.1 tyrosine-type recombinase/integrase [Salmonella enterica subsp. enterica serovar Hvittingfoss]
MRKYITDNEWCSFFKAITNSVNECRDKTMFYLMYIHGLRVSEVIGLTLSDIDLKEKIIYIRRLKNGFSTVHPLHMDELSLLNEWMNIRSSYVNSTLNSWLFLSAYGKKISRQWIYKICKKYGQKSGIPLNLHPHMLRHACGYALANQGLDTRLIQDYLGHRNIHYTVLYTASNAERFRKAWKNPPSLFSPDSP